MSHRHNETAQVQVITGPPGPDAVERVNALSALVEPVFAGEHPGVVGAVLADLTALLIAGHQVTAEEHEQLLQHHIEAIRSLLPLQIERVRRIKPVQ